MHITITITAGWQQQPRLMLWCSLAVALVLLVLLVLFVLRRHRLTHIKSFFTPLCSMPRTGILST